MSEERKQPCDPDDVVCQMEVLRHVKGLQEQLGNEAFIERFPELQTLKDRLPDEIRRQEEVVEQSISDCTEQPPAAEVAASEAEPAPEPEPVEEEVEESGE